MPAPSDADFFVGRFPQVDPQLRLLAKKAKQRGVFQEYLDILTKVIRKLERDPLGWGDPEYHPIAPGSTVCHGSLGMLFVQYVVFERERVVMMMLIKAIPASILD